MHQETIGGHAVFAPGPTGALNFNHLGVARMAWVRRNPLLAVIAAYSIGDLPDTLLGTTSKLIFTVWLVCALCVALRRRVEIK